MELPSNNDKRIEQIRNLIEYPGENPYVDYKSAEKFEQDTDFALKLVKHILGFANAGGGFLVIGFLEDSNKNLVSDTKMNNELLGSYEPTRLSQYINKHVIGSNQVELLVDKPISDKKSVVIEVKGFKQVPYFCKSTKGAILKEGALYIRSSDTNTVELAKPQDWEKLLRVAVEARNADLIDSFRSLMLDAGINTNNTNLLDTGTSLAFSKWLSDIEKDALNNFLAVKDELKTNSYFQVITEPLKPSSDIIKTNDELLKVVDQSVVRKSGWPFGVVLYNTEFKPKPMVNGVTTKMLTKSFVEYYDQWDISKSLAFQLFRSIPTSPDNKINFDTRIWRLAEAFDFLFNLYTNLGFSNDTELHIKFKHSGLRGTQLSASSQMRAFSMHERTTEEDEVTWERVLRLEQFNVGKRDLIKDILKSLFELYDFFQLADSVLDEVLLEYSKS